MNEVCDEFTLMFPNDLSLVQECHQIYSDFQDYLRRQYKNEKTLNNFLIGISENSQIIETKDLTRLIGKQDTIHEQRHELYSQFVQVVKQECVMDNHYFTFTSLPELIVRKNYTRKEYEQITKLLFSIKNTYLEFRAKKEPDNVDDQQKQNNENKNPNVPVKKDNGIITEEDMIDLQLLDDFLTSHQRAFDQKKSLWHTFIQKANDAKKDKLESLKELKPTEAQRTVIDQYVFSNMLNNTLEKLHEEMFEFHYKHEILEGQLVKKKRNVGTADALNNTLRLVMGCEDPNYKINLADSPNAQSRPNQQFGRDMNFQKPAYSSQTKTNFWDENLEVPLTHSYSS